MRSSDSGTLALVGLILACGIAQARPAVSSEPVERYEEVRDWPRLPPTVQLGECAGVAVDTNGHVFIFHRPGRGFDPSATVPLEEPAVLEVDPDSGALINAWGAGTFLVPHGITIDESDNVFLTDVGLQQVFKFSHDGRLLLTLGERRVGGWDATHFNQPTDIAIRRDGTFYVSDGYVNSRVAVFDAGGKHVREWGRKGTGPGEFRNPHGLAFLPANVNSASQDPSPKSQDPTSDILVADRENARLQLFDEAGVFKRQWVGQKDAATTGRVFSVVVDALGYTYVGIRRDDYDTQHTGVIKLDRDWRTVTSIGFGNPGDPVFNAVHDLAVGPDGSIYVAETRTKRVVKLRPVTLANAVTTTQSEPITEYHLPPDTLTRAEALYRTAVAMFVVGTLYSLAVLVLVLTLRVAPRFRDLAERLSARRFVQALVFVPLLLITIDVVSLPLSMYGHYLQASYGLSVQGWSSWFWDWAKGEAVGLVIATPLVWGLYAILRRSPTRWWLYGWLGLIPIVLLLVLIAPVFIDPLFNTYEPLESRQPQLVPALEEVLARGGVSIERSRMFEMQASDKVTTYNAYVTGIGASKRVVVWDNTARDLTVPETMFVFGHEQGHYVLNHIWWGLAFSVLALLGALYLAYRVVGGVLAQFGERWAIRGLTDWASLPVLMLILSVFSVVAQPVAAGFSRVLEHQADVYGLEVIHGVTPDSSQVAAHAFQKLGEKGLAYPSPNPLYVFWAYDHPPVQDRLRFALGYRPWDEGQPARYVR